MRRSLRLVLLATIVAVSPFAAYRLSPWFRSRLISGWGTKMAYPETKQNTSSDTTVIAADPPAPYR